jgi:hypothetical protein
MFIERQQHPTIEFDPATGQTKPSLAHFFSNQVDPLKSALPLLAAGGEEQVLVVAAPLSELLDETFRLHRPVEFPDTLVVDENHRAFFDAVKLSLAQALAKIEEIEYVVVDDDE